MAIEDLLDLPEFPCGGRGVSVEFESSFELISGCGAQIAVGVLLPNGDKQLLEEFSDAGLRLRLSPVLQSFCEKRFKVTSGADSGQEDKNGFQLFFGSSRFAASMAFEGVSNEPLQFVIAGCSATSIRLK